MTAALKMLTNYTRGILYISRTKLSYVLLKVDYNTIFLTQYFPSKLSSLQKRVEHDNH